MVSNHPNPGEGFYLDPTGMALPELSPFAATATPTSPSAEDLSKKIRKPYTITKSRESWTDPEHDKFLEALQLFDRDWKKIEAFVGSKTVIQIRSHAQKYFLKVQKTGVGEHLPPPRPKRKAAHPYPQKASKNGPVVSQPLGSYLSSPGLLEPEYALRADSSSMPVAPIPGTAPSSGAHNLQTGPMMTNNCCSSTESAPRIKPSLDMLEQENNNQPQRVLPDFAQVYRFIGSLCDPNVTGHLQKLKKMDYIDVDTVLLLMRNLSINLTSPDFEDQRNLVSSYEIDTETTEATEILDGE